MNMDMDVAVTTTTTAMAMPSSTAVSMAMSMGGSSNCKLSMLLNWHTIDACFLSSAFKIRSSFGFFLACLAAFLLVISLEFLRRSQRYFDRYLRARNTFLREKEYGVPTEELEEKLLAKEGTAVGSGKERILVVVLEQGARGLLHVLQFAVSYCIMLLFMYSNGYIIISILFGALVGFAMFTRDTLYSKIEDDGELKEKDCC